MTYSTADDSYKIFGKDNIDKWADRNNRGDSDEITATIDWAIDEAFARVNGRLEGCRYTVPFVAPFDTLVINLSARVVGLILYDSRLIVDAEPMDMLSLHRKQVEMDYKAIHGAKLSLLAHETNAVRYPQAVVEENLL